ncbi:carboxypeptidase-like regulatory domain-containing protein [Haloparvum sp. PAK95]|uniref:carboxypeptidase-like regulatory domain-containing protein n=1 Tax=Haloparvum sp. PAK95 TaxID=3418962 RepID=UPI003D2EEBBF
MNATVTAISVVALLLVSPIAGAGAATTQDTVTLTVSVETVDGDAVGNADLNATWDGGSAQETTASNGKAFVDVPASADVTIEVDHPDYVRNDPYVVENATARDVTVEVAEKGGLAVVATENNESVADAQVVVRKDGDVVVRGTTNDQGAFDSGVIEQGEYDVSVVKPGYYRETRTVTVDGNVTETVALESGSVELSISVVDDHFEQPEALQGVSVQIGDVASVTTLSNGETSVRVPVNTKLKLRTSKDGYESTTKTVSVRESATDAELAVNRVDALNLTPANERMVAGERLSVTVTDEYGEVVEGVTVTLDGEVVGETEADGTLRFEVSEPGNHTLVATGEGVESSPVRIRAISDEPDATATATETAAATDTPTTTTEESADGFGVGLALLALVAVALVAVGRRR